MEPRKQRGRGDGIDNPWPKAASTAPATTEPAAFGAIITRRSEYLSPAEFAERLNMSPRWVRDQIKAGELKATRMGLRVLRIPKAEAQAFEQRLAATKG